MRFQFFLHFRQLPSASGGVRQPMCPILINPRKKYIITQNNSKPIFVVHSPFLKDLKRYRPAVLVTFTLPPASVSPFMQFLEIH